MTYAKAAVEDKAIGQAQEAVPYVPTHCDRKKPHAYLDLMLKDLPSLHPPNASKGVLASFAVILSRNHASLVRYLGSPASDDEKEQEIKAMERIAEVPSKRTLDSIISQFPKLLLAAFNAPPDPVTSFTATAAMIAFSFLEETTRHLSNTPEWTEDLLPFVYALKKYQSASRAALDRLSHLVRDRVGKERRGA